MNKLRKLPALLSLLAIFFVLTSTTANAGILLSDLSSNQPEVDVCKDSSEDKVDSGIIVHFGGIIIHFVDTVIGNDETSDCGIIIH
jgi:hypothetical protein